MTIGERLRILRDAKSITLKKLSEDIGVNYTTLSNYERDYRIPELKTLIKLSEYYNTPIDIIVGNDRIEKKLEYEKYLRIFNKKIIPVVSLKNCEIEFDTPISEKYFIDTIVMPNNVYADFGVMIEDKSNFPDMELGDIAIVTSNFNYVGMVDLFLLNDPRCFKYVSEIEDEKGLLIHSKSSVREAEFLEQTLDDFLEFDVLGMVSAIIKREFNGIKSEEFFRNKEKNNPI